MKFYKDLLSVVTLATMTYDICYNQVNQRPQTAEIDRSRGCSGLSRAMQGAWIRLPATTTLDLPWTGTLSPSYREHWKDFCSKKSRMLYG